MEQAVRFALLAGSAGGAGMTLGAPQRPPSEGYSYEYLRRDQPNLVAGGTDDVLGTTT